MLNVVNDDDDVDLLLEGVDREIGVYVCVYICVCGCGCTSVCVCMCIRVCLEGECV